MANPAASVYRRCFPVFCPKADARSGQKHVTYCYLIPLFNNDEFFGYEPDHGR